MLRKGTLSTALGLGVCVFAPLSQADLTAANKALPVDAATLTPITPSEHWQLIWQDNFSASSLDTHKWSIEYNCWGGGNNEQQCYTPSQQNVFINNGLLVLQAEKGDTTGPALTENHAEYSKDSTRTLPYSSGRVRSKGKGDWIYGRFEFRAKLPKGQGTWPAIWMLPTDNVYGTWAASGEIDIMEAVNLGTKSDAKNASNTTPETRIHGTLHYGAKWPNNTYTGAGVVLPNNINPADGFHEYAIEWEQDEIRWYIDNYHFLTQQSSLWFTRTQSESGEWTTAPNDAPFNERFHIVLNLAIGGQWPENANDKGIDDSHFPKQLIIDYVRVYQCSKNPNTGKGCSAVDPQARVIN